MNDGLWRGIYGRAAVLDPDGSVAWSEPWRHNFLADEGEQIVLDVFLREGPNPEKFLALLETVPTGQTTMKTMNEIDATGYQRQQVTSEDWDPPTLGAGGYRTTSSMKAFGPAREPWRIASVGLVTAPAGTEGRFVLAVELSAVTVVNPEQTFLYALNTFAG